MKTKQHRSRRESRLTEKEKAAMLAVKGGADVWSYELAQTLRGIQRKAPQLLSIGRAMMGPEDGAAVQPYFGVMPTAAGLAAAENTHAEEIRG